MSKLRIISALLGSIGAFAPLTANADISDLFGVGHEMPASVDETVHLGMPFNAMSGQFQHYRCINGPIVEAVENGSSELVLQQGLTESEIRKYLSGSISAGFNSELLDGVLGAEAGAGLARSLSESETSISYSYGYELEKIVESLVVDSFNSEGLPEHISSECLDLIDLVSDTSQHIDNSTLASMGTHLLTNISYGASLFANLKISTRTATEKSQINGMLDISSGILDISGNLNDLSEDTRRNTTVEVYVRQLGGEPRKLLESLSAENGNDGTAVVARCDLNDIGPCRDIFTEIIRYAKDGFQDSLVDEYGYLDASRLARINYFVTPFANYNLTSLMLDELSQHAADESGYLIEMLQAYEAYSEKLLLVENAIFYSNEFYSDSYRANLYALRDKLSYSKQLFRKASAICRNDFIIGSNCESARSEIYNSSISADLSAIPVSSEAFNELFYLSEDIYIESSSVTFKTGLTNGPVNESSAGVVFSWQVINASSCSVEIQDESGELVEDFVYIDSGADGSVLISVGTISGYLFPNSWYGDGSSYVEEVQRWFLDIKLICSDPFQTTKLVLEESIDLHDDNLQLSEITYEHDLIELKLNNYTNIGSNCWVRARWSILGVLVPLYDDQWTEWFPLDADGNVSIGLTPIGVSYLPYESFIRPFDFMNPGESELEDYPYAFDVFSNPYEYLCVF